MHRKRWGIGLVFVWFFVGGVTHLLRPQFFMPAMPPMFPDPMLLILVSGVFELLGALGVLWQRSRRWAGYGRLCSLFVLTICVTPVNIDMWQHAQLFPAIAPALLGWRLVLQVLLLACIAWATSPEPRSAAIRPQTS
jgi:uncharacterized membrane protein